MTIDELTEKIEHALKDEAQGNEGRKAWNARPQSAEEAQQMLAGAIATIDRLIDTVAAMLVDARHTHQRIAEVGEAIDRMIAVADGAVNESTLP